MKEKVQVNIVGDEKKVPYNQVANEGNSLYETYS